MKLRKKDLKDKNKSYKNLNENQIRLLGENKEIDLINTIKFNV